MPLRGQNGCELLKRSPRGCRCRKSRLRAVAAGDTTRRPRRAAHTAVTARRLLQPSVRLPPTRETGAGCAHPAPSGPACVSTTCPITAPCEPTSPRTPQRSRMLRRRRKAGISRSSSSLKGLIVSSSKSASLSSRRLSPKPVAMTVTRSSSSRDSLMAAPKIM